MSYGRNLGLLLLKIHSFLQDALLLSVYIYTAYESGCKMSKDVTQVFICPTRIESPLPPCRLTTGHRLSPRLLSEDIISRLPGPYIVPCRTHWWCRMYLVVVPTPGTDVNRISGKFPVSS